MRKTAFLVGRTTGRNTLVVLVGLTQCPIIGPWTIRAVVSTN